jgi:FkbM family methyltransferase
MLRKIFIKIINYLGKLSSKKFVYFPQDRAKNNLSAVKSDLGFWYAGNVLDTSDMAYGVLYNGEVEADGTKLVGEVLKQLLTKKQSLVFYDIGANTGYFGVMAAFLGKGKITTYSFEPVIEFNEIERETLKLNSLQSICKIFNIALSNKEGTAEIFLAGTGTSINKKFQGRQFPSRRVPMQKLDNLVTQENLFPADFLKIDVEGHELAVLQGAEQSIKKALPVIWFESALTLKVNNFKNADFFATQDFLKGLGYRVFFCGPELTVVPLSSIADGVAMYLALHPEMHKDLLTELKV